LGKLFDSNVVFVVYTRFPFQNLYVDDPLISEKVLSNQKGMEVVMGIVDIEPHLCGGSFNNSTLGRF